jgi:hypothetical protein
VQFYTEDELRRMEAGADEVHAKAAAGRLPGSCFHDTRGRGGALKRTKFFFGARCGYTPNLPGALSKVFSTFYECLAECCRGQAWPVYQAQPQQ